MTYFNPYITDLRERPAQFFAGMCVFFVAVMGTSVNHVASTCYSLMLLAGLFSVRYWLPTWKTLSGSERWMLTGLGIYAFSGAVAVVNVEDMAEYSKDIERYLRFLFAIPMYLFLRKYRVTAIRYLYAGAIVSGPFLLAVAINSIIESPGMPARGHYHHIIFGSLAMLNVGIMLSLLLTRKLTTIERMAILISIACAIATAIMSQSRGVWLVMPVYLVITLYISWKRSLKNFFLVSIVLLTGTVGVIMSPASDVIGERVDQAIEEVDNFYSEGRYATSVGQRLVMWQIAYEQWQQYPVFGIGPGDFDDIVMALQEAGEFQGMEIHASVHNIYVQSLVNTGAVGLAALILGLFYLPARMMLSHGKIEREKAYVGISVLLLFAVVGLSESWILRSSIISVYILYLVIIASAFGNVKDREIYI